MQPWKFIAEIIANLLHGGQRITLHGGQRITLTCMMSDHLHTHVAFINVVMHGTSESRAGVTQIVTHGSSESRCSESRCHAWDERITRYTWDERISLHCCIVSWHCSKRVSLQCSKRVSLHSEFVTHNLLQWISVRLHACTFFSIYCLTFSTPPPQHHQVQSTRVPG